MTKKVHCTDLGVISYKQAWDMQAELFQQVIDAKLRLRENPESNLPEHHLLFCEHPHVYTLGKSGKPQHLLLDEKGLEIHQAEFFPVNRGGDITYHGPGQLVMYPIFDLDQIYTDIHRFLRDLEEAVILTLADWGISAGRYPGYTGVWLDSDQPKARKICAMGIKCSRWVTMHGIGFNVNTDLGYFGHIVPCGIDDKAVTSMQNELGHAVELSAVRSRLLHHLTNIFELDAVTA
jgi:lipoyl(octanoyl) transferase